MKTIALCCSVLTAAASLAPGATPTWPAFRGPNASGVAPDAKPPVTIGPTNAVDGGRVVTYFGSFGLIRHDLQGTELWRHPLPLALSFGGYGTCTSPLQIGRPFYLEERLNAGGSYYASPVAADGRIYAASLPGKLMVIKAGGDRPEILHQVEFGERIHASPAIAGHHLDLRTRSALDAFGEPAGP